MRIGAVLLVASCSFEAGTLPQASGDAAAIDDAILAGDSNDAAPTADAPCADADNDGVCNSDDAWPCGPAPAAPPSSYMLQRNGGATKLALSMISYAGQGQLAVVAANSSANLTLNYQFTDTACASNCRDQIEVGWTPGGRVGCAFDATVSKTNGTSGSGMRAMTAPATPGVYTIRANIGQNTSCGTTTSYWALEPASQAEVVTVCVQ